VSTGREWPNDELEREFKSLKQLKGHCARCVHREIKQNRKKANVGSVEPGALADQAALQNYRGELARGPIRGMSGYGTTAYGGAKRSFINLPTSAKVPTRDSCTAVKSISIRSPSTIENTPAGMAKPSAFRSFEVDDLFELCFLLDRQIRGLLNLEDSTNIEAQRLRGHS
jgi:hypothetical protein